MLQKIRNEKGVTLIEVVVVLAIVVILAALAAVGPGFLRSDNISRFSRELYGDLYKARQDAMTRSTLIPGSNPQRVGIGSGIRFVSNTSYVIFEFDDANNNFQYDAGEELNPVVRNLGSSIVIQRLTGGALVNPNNNVLIYDKLGIPRNTGWALAPMTFVVRHQSEQARGKCVVVSTNKIREGLWNGNTCQEQ